MSRIGQYQHIPVKMQLNLAGIAERLVETNYGVHNMLSQIVIAYYRKHPERAIRNSEEQKSWDIVVKIEKHLNSGDF
jgi:hypothetical protein